jgi:DNA invertase Pin-like site-specific DNA recombinase
MIADLQPGEVVVAEKIDRISRLPLAEAEQLVCREQRLEKHERSIYM